MNVSLFWPPRETSPNWRGHWATKARSVKKYRRDCWLIALGAGVRVDWEGDIHLGITFHPPSRRRYDQDNLIASLKSGLDGLADALKVNDTRSRIHAAMGHPEKGGKVFITIEEDWK